MSTFNLGVGCMMYFNVKWKADNCFKKYKNGLKNYKLSTSLKQMWVTTISHLTLFTLSHYLPKNFCKLRLINQVKNF